MRVQAVSNYIFFGIARIKNLPYLCTVQRYSHYTMDIKLNV